MPNPDQPVSPAAPNPAAEPQPQQNPHLEGGGESDEVAHPAPDQEEREVGHRELHTLIHNQLRHHCERGRPKWQLSQSAEMEEIYSDSAKHILEYDLEISKDTGAESLREWIDNLKQNPDLLKELYNEFK